MRRVLNVENVECSFGKKKILSNISFTVYDNEKIIILGHNGSGKTLLIDCILGNIKYTGNIETEIKNKKEIGVLYDQFSTLPLLKVKEVVDLLSSIYGKKQNEQLLHNLGIIPLMNKYFKVLSKGERKKLGLYSCLFFEPKYLFLDEPTDGLDPEFREFFWQYIKNSEVTLLLTTHLWEEAIRVADKVMFIENGRILNTPQTYEILYKEIGLIGKIVLESKIDFENKDKYKHYFTEDRLLVYYKTEQEKKELLEYIQSKELFGYSVLPIDITDIYYCLKTSKR